MVSWLLQVCCDLGQPALYAEHGEGQPLGRPCISHTHVHILPGLAHLVEDLGSLLPSMATDSSTSYMIYGRKDLELRRDASGTRSQYLRRAIAQYLGVDTWDYAAFPNDDDVERTIEYWTANLRRGAILEGGAQTRQRLSRHDAARRPGTPPSRITSPTWDVSPTSPITSMP
jgi:hypothetical protein